MATRGAARRRDADLRDDPPAYHPPPPWSSPGTHDPATPPSLGDRIREGIAGARGIALDAAHLANASSRKRYAAVIEFLTH